MKCYRNAYKFLHYVSSILTKTELPSNKYNIYIYIKKISGLWTTRFEIFTLAWLRIPFFWDIRVSVPNISKEHWKLITQWCIIISQNELLHMAGRTNRCIFATFYCYHAQNITNLAWKVQHSLPSKWQVNTDLE